MTSSKWTSLPIKEALGRAGLAARAVIYVAISVLLFLGAFIASEDADGATPKEAFRDVESWPFGELLLFALGICLLGYTAFRLLQALTEEQEPEWSARLARTGMVASGVSYGIVGVTSISMAVGRVSQADSNQTKSMAQTLLEQPFGRWGIVILGLVLVGIAGAQIYRALSERWKSNLDLSQTPDVWIKASSFAISGRGLLILVAGISVVWAGVVADSSEAMGLTSVLSWLRSAPFGFVLYVSSGLVMLGYGIYGLVQSATYEFSQ